MKNIQEPEVYTKEELRLLQGRIADLFSGLLVESSSKMDPPPADC